MKLCSDKIKENYFNIGYCSYGHFRSFREGKNPLEYGSTHTRAVYASKIIQKNVMFFLRILHDEPDT